jgi:hypothetical protein
MFYENRGSRGGQYFVMWCSKVVYLNNHNRDESFKKKKGSEVS